MFQGGFGLQGNSSSGSPIKGCKLKFNAKGNGVDKMDRFIPSRSATDFEAANFILNGENGDISMSPAKEEYQKLIAVNLNVPESGRILAFKQKAPAAPEGFDNGLKGLYNQNLGPLTSKKQYRHIPSTQERILDAPELLDDYYLNLLDWSCTNTIAVALGRSVYLWNASTGAADELCQCPVEGDYICSVAWGSDGNFLAIGTSDAKLQIWDVVRKKQVRELVGHTNRVSCAAWNGSILSSGGRDSLINNWDVRKRRDEACIASLRVHDQEVCGLKWSPCGQQLASGGNDNNLCIFDSNFRLQHKVQAHCAAVKALAWCPFQANLLASGGGTADRCMKFWNTHTGALLHSVDTGSQVCSLQWSRHEREILSSHGYSKNQLCLWRYPSLTKVAELMGHSGRVLHMGTSPDGASVVTAGADETIRFWKVFGEPPPPKVMDKMGLVAGGTMVGVPGVGGGGLRSIR